MVSIYFLFKKVMPFAQSRFITVKIHSNLEYLLLYFISLR